MKYILILTLSISFFSFDAKAGEVDPFFAVDKKY